MRTSRRGFLKTLGGVALFSIVPRHVLGNGYIMAHGTGEGDQNL